ncbi:MAG TPA: hypothetical protein VK927_00280, partial [Adhaeribacter sp.]|nr:hypothetical protein [Adhaeribacter sp.]
NAPAVRRFRSNYLNRYNIPPSRYAFAGYEMLYFFGSLLHNHGPQFQTFLPEIPTVSGVFYKGFYYNNAPDNQVVPILKMEDRRLVQPATPVAPANK